MAIIFVFYFIWKCVRVGKWKNIVVKIDLLLNLYLIIIEWTINELMNIEIEMNKDIQYTVAFLFIKINYYAIIDGATYIKQYQINIKFSNQFSSL